MLNAPTVTCTTACPETLNDEGERGGDDVWESSDKTTVRTGCQEHLNGTRDGSWEKQVTCYLDANYPKWKGPKGTYMVPSEFLNRTAESDIGEQTEKDFYDLLQHFGAEHREPMFVVHSYNFAELISNWNNKLNRRETTWLTGEHDFVIIHHKHGIIFFQVKAAAKTVKAYSKAKGQIEKDKKALQAFINEILKKICKKDDIKKKNMNSEIYRYPGFVVMPNCPRPNDPVGEPTIGVFQEDSENVNAFFEWWGTNISEVKRETPFDQAFYKYLVMRFVGMMHSIPEPLSKSIDKTTRVLEMCTKRQLEVLCHSEPKKWITGPAGSGKTWLLMKKVLMLAENAVLQGTNEKILVSCFNRPLSVMFAKTFEVEFQGVVTVKTFHSLLHAITKSISGKSNAEKEKHFDEALDMVKKGTGYFPERYDHIFVDECQDLFGKEWPTLFEKLQKDDGDGPKRKHIWFFYDANQNLRILEKEYEPHRNLIMNGQLLPDVFRNTRMVFEQTKKYLTLKILDQETIKLAHDVRGLNIKWDCSLSQSFQGSWWERCAKCINKCIKDLRKDEVNDKDICILTQIDSYRKEISSKLKEMGIESQNAEEMFQKDDNKVVVESIWRFKGLESKVVILLYWPRFSRSDPSKMSYAMKEKQLLYTAFSRCFCYLIVVSTEHGCKVLKSQKVSEI